MLKLLHWIALRISDTGRLLAHAGEWLWELGGGLECWCDERAYRRKWLRWAKDNKLSVTWLTVPELDPSDFAMPHPDAALPTPRPLTLLDGDA